MNKIKLVIDKDIPYIGEFIEENFEPHYYSANEITKKEVKDADAIIIRTLTKCNTDLLEGTNVKLIITATIGDDHIDKEYCQQNNIEIRRAEACNSNAVVQYVIMSLYYLQNNFTYPWKEKTIGIIGVGNIGSRLNSIFKCLGVKTLLYDPPREEREEKKEFVSLEEIRQNADIISLHTPLTMQGKHPTKHLLKDDFFAASSRKIVLINSSRGAVLSTKTLLKWYKRGVIKHLIMDVWENEPLINQDLLAISTLSTPHIAGYSLRGKINATYMSIGHLNSFFQIPNNKIDTIFSYIPQIQITYRYNASLTVEENIWEVLNQIWDIQKDSMDLRSKPSLFSNLRVNYNFRKEFSDTNIRTSFANDKFKHTLDCLNISISDNYNNKQ